METMGERGVKITIQEGKETENKPPALIEVPTVTMSSKKRKGGGQKRGILGEGVSGNAFSKTVSGKKQK